MHLTNLRRTMDLLSIFSLFFLSNILAFGYAFWLVPVLVLLVTVVWLLLTSLSLWNLNRQNLMTVFLNHLGRNWIIFPFLFFSALSILWSVNQEISLYRWLVLVCTVITGAYIGLRYSMKEIFNLLSVFGIYILLVSAILVFLIPDIGIMNYYIIQGAWKGVFWHKNHMGLFTTFINILFLMNIILSWESGAKSTLLWLLLYLFSLGFLYQSDSVAAYMTTILLHSLVLLGWLFVKFKERILRRHYLMFGLLGLIAVALLAANLDRVFGLFNRNTTLTGRIPMWRFLFTEFIDKRPLVGYGFNAFWYIPAYQVATQLAAGYPDTIIIADNGFIDILVNTGYLGLLLFLIFYFGVWWRSLEHAWKAQDFYGLFPVVLMAYTLIANMSWSLIFENEGFFMLVMMAVLFCMSRGQEVTS